MRFPSPHFIVDCLQLHSSKEGSLLQEIADSIILLELYLSTLGMAPSSLPVVLFGYDCEEGLARLYGCTSLTWIRRNSFSVHA